MSLINNLVTFALYASFIVYRLFLWEPPIEMLYNNLVCIWR